MNIFFCIWLKIPEYVPHLSILWSTFVSFAILFFGQIHSNNNIFPLQLKMKYFCLSIILITFVWVLWHWLTTIQYKWITYTYKNTSKMIQKNELGNYRRIIDVKLFAMIIIFGMNLWKLCHQRKIEKTWVSTLITMLAIFHIGKVDKKILYLRLCERFVKACSKFSWFEDLNY